jgi:integrase
MARHKLTEKKIKEELTRPGVYGDGDGLWLRVQKSGSRNWLFIYRRGSDRVELGLGGYGSGTAPISLARAREKADEIRKLLSEGADPRAGKQAKLKTFEEVARSLIADKKPGWTGEHTVKEWELHLLTYAAPLHKKAVASIVLGDVKECILPYWKMSTGKRLLDKIRAVFDYAIAHEWRQTKNPAVWKDRLETVMPKPAVKTKHHAALSYENIPALMQSLREQTSFGSRATEFLILTATRSNETREAVWTEVDLDKALWTIPAARMKADNDHEIPLSERAVDILKVQKQSAVNDFVFPGQREKKPIGEDALMSALREASPDKAVTLHGTARSSFRDWCGDVADVPREIAEAALAHVVGDETERAYRRGTALQKRRTLMQQWADFCASTP